MFRQACGDPGCLKDDGQGERERLSPPSSSWWSSSAAPWQHSSWSTPCAWRAEPGQKVSGLESRCCQQMLPVTTSQRLYREVEASVMWFWENSPFRNCPFRWFWGSRNRRVWSCWGKTQSGWDEVKQAGRGEYTHKQVLTHTHAHAHTGTHRHTNTTTH